MLVEEKFEQVESLDEALTSWEGYRPTIETRPIQDLSFEIEGFLVNGEKSDITSEALFGGFCKALRIPRAYAQRIPTSLLAENINELVRGQSDLIVDVARSPQGYVTNVCKSTLTLPTDRVITALQDKTQEEGQFDFKRIGIGDRGLSVQFVDSALEEIEPEVGDITQVGYDIWNSENGFGSLVGNSYLHRLVCENGAVMPSKCGVVRRSFDKRFTDPDLLINRFFGQLLSLNALQDLALTDVFTNMNNTNLMDVKASKYSFKLHKILEDWSIVDSIMQWDPERRDAIVSRVRANKAEAQRTGEDVQEEEIPLRWYDMYNGVTTTARDCTLMTRKTLERLGGVVVNDFMKINS